MHFSAVHSGFKEVGPLRPIAAFPSGSPTYYVPEHLDLQAEVGKQSKKTLLNIFERYIERNMTLSDAIWSVSATVLHLT